MPKLSTAVFPKLFLLISCLTASASAQPGIIAALDFDPKMNGFGFKNYRNEGDRWKDDIAADDLIRMFGVRAACKSGSDAKSCVLKAAARKWIEHYLKAMDIGHCEGIGVASLRMNSLLPFKKRASPLHFQAGAKSPFDLRLDQSLENYFAYYWITQTFDEITVPTAKIAERGPNELVKTLAAAMNDKSDTFLIGLKKYEKGRIFDGHAVTPFAVEDAGKQYKIYVYDNNAPGETRFLYVNKSGTQQWTYSSVFNRRSTPDYVGDITTKTLDLTATSWRENRCFDASFAADGDRETGCGAEIVRRSQPIYTRTSFAAAAPDADGEDAEFFLTGEGEMLVTDGDTQRRIGYDPKTDRYFNEISGGNPQMLIGGLNLDLPHYTLPYDAQGKPYKIVFSGKNLDAESVLDFVFSAPGFTVGFDGIRLDPAETLTATISPDGEEITFTSSFDGETPEVFYAFDADDDADSSYLTTIGGVQLAANKNLRYDFDFSAGKLFFSDDDGGEDEYDIELIRLNADGTEEIYAQNDLNIGTADSYEMDFAAWDGEEAMCFKDDEDGDGFGDEQCTAQPNEYEEGDADAGN